MSDMDRTVCACEACRQCCREQPGSLAPGDAERMAAHLGLTVRELGDRHLCASPGAVVMDTHTRKVFRIPTITPRRKAYSGACVFLQPDGRCKVHAAAPAGCAYFDTHMTTEEAQRRSLHFASASAEDAEYAALRATLPVATAWKPRSY